MHECLKRWEQFMNQRGQMPELVQGALIHEHFEAIHPFPDGNGRIGRLLIRLFVIERGRLSKPLLHPSSYIEQNKAAYDETLQRIRTHGDWPAWLRCFLAAVRDTSRNAINQSQMILKLRDDCRQKLAKQHRALALLDELFTHPYTTVARASEQLGVTAPTATKTIDALARAGMLAEATGARWGRVWLARPILDAVEASPPMASA
jgi:Fic family protein